MIFSCEKDDNFEINLDWFGTQWGSIWVQLAFLGPIWGTFPDIFDEFSSDVASVVFVSFFHRFSTELAPP